MRYQCLEGEKCGEIYKLKEENSVGGGVLMNSLERSSQGETSRKIATGREPSQSVVVKFQEKETCSGEARV